ncbi:MAG: glycosyltransferase family 4 protein [Balneolaceae bacterium]|nr:glycosyltransferase family 4 protein [Balneolaceae bacterium]
MADLIVIIGVILITGGNYIFTGWFIKYARLRRITDVPTERSSHTIPTPRGGGIGFVFITVIAFTIYFVWEGLLTSPTFITMLVAISAIACLGWFDDRNDLSQKVRLSVQLLAALGVIFFIDGLDTFFLPYISYVQLGFTGTFFGLLWITGVTNIYNFMDGVDGIASVQALSASFGWIIFSFIWNEPILLTVNLFIFVSVLSFLVYNWSPARIFMGDVGSVYLGFLFGIMPFLAGALSDELTVGMTIWIGALVLWPFLFDGTFTLFRRLRNGENVFEAHRTHLYQRLNIIGWSHSKISTLYLTFSLITTLIALFYIHEKDTIRLLLLILLLALSFIYVKTVQWAESKSN